MKSKLSLKKAVASAWRPALALVAAILVSSLILVIFGYDVGESYKAMFTASFKNLRTLSNLINNSTPLLFCGLAVAISYRGSVFNIGAEGQFIAGTIAACWVGVTFNTLPGIALIVLMMLAGALAGALWAYIPGMLKARYDINEVITTIMFNYIALNIIGCLTRTVLRDTNQADPQSFPIAEQGWMPYLIPGTKMNSGFVVAVLIAIVLYIVLFKTPFGFEVRSVGFNKIASQYAGISVKNVTIKTMMIAGAVAGLGGAIEVTGASHYIFEKISNGFGYTGIAISVLANNNPLGVILSALLFGFLKTGSTTMQRLVNASAQFTTVIQGIVILFIAVSASSNASTKRNKKSKEENKKEGEKV